MLFRSGIQQKHTMGTPEFPILPLLQDRYWCAACSKQVHPTQVSVHQQKHAHNRPNAYCKTCCVDLQTDRPPKGSYQGTPADRQKYLLAYKLNIKSAHRRHWKDTRSKTSHTICEANKAFMLRHSRCASSAPETTRARIKEDQTSTGSY